MKWTKQEAIDALVGYVYESEYDDFYKNPSENHVYFAALILLDGITSARLSLKEALDALE